jgi:CheY-like chemotaxis protein/tetratricopeptide (TPR) repeat protein
MVFQRGSASMPHRVLVVDDEENIRSLIQDYLEGQGYRVFSAIDGDQGIRKLDDVKPHLVIIDFLLPRKNGFAVAEAVRERPGGARVPIIMMSGVFKNPKTAVEAREKYQVLEFLAKPIDMQQLGELVQDALQAVEPEPEPDVSTMEASAPKPPASNTMPARSKPAAARGLSYGPTLATSEAITGEHQIVGGIYSGRPFPVLPEEGSIEEYPAALLLSTIRYDSGTGMLDMTDQGTHRRIYIIRGNPTFMQSNAEGENVGALLLRRGRITEPDFERCQRYMNEKGRTLQQSLLELRLITEAELATAYKLLAGQLLPLALGMATGSFHWRETDAFIGRVPEGKFEPIAVLLDGIKRHVHPPQILKFFRGREDVPLIKTREFDKLMPFFRRTFSATNIASEIDGGSTYRSITRKHSQDAASTVPQLFALVASGMAVLPQISEDNAMEVAVNIAAAEIAEISVDIAGSDGVDFRPDDEDGDVHPDDARARGNIERFHDQVMSKDFFQIFGVSRESDGDQIKAAYFELAKKWHADTFAGRNLGRTKRKLDEIFARITEAYETITNQQRREEYMVYLDRKAKGLPTDVNEIFRGEQLYDQAMAMVRRRDWKGAKSVLDEAVTLNPDPLYFATLGWVTFNLNSRSQTHITEAVQHLKRAVGEQENLPVAYQYLGQICFVRGQYAEAKRWWNKCIEFEPNNIEATRGIRMVNDRAEKQPSGGSTSKGSGLLGKFLSGGGGKK